jgi:hypothetical protein
MFFRAAFLILAAAAIFNVSAWKAGIVLIGYLSFAYLDQWLAKRAKNKVIEGETSGWETDSDDPAWETKGNLARVKLTGHEQIIVTRVAEILRRIP